jgi:hypothetical protein
MDRASIHAALARIRAGESDGIIVALADRIGRAPIEEAMATVREFGTIGKLVLADMGGTPLDLNEATVETNLVMQLQFARQYWLMTANRFQRSQRDAVKAGRFIGPTPLGYKRHTSGPDKGRLYPDRKRGPVVTRAYKVAAHGGIHAAIAYLEEMVPERKWTTDAVRKLLRSRVYLGESNSGTLHNPDAHEPLIDLDTWTAAQSAPRGRRKNLEYPLTGVARCAECGERLHGQFQTAASGNTFRRYRCSNAACGGGSSILASALEEYVRGWLERALATRSPIRELFTPGNLEQARDDLKRAKAERTAYIRKTPAADPDYEVGREDRDRVLSAAQERYDALAAQAARVDELPAADELHKPEQFQRALAAMIDHVTVRRGRGTVDDRVEIVWRGLDHEHVARALGA